MWIRSQDKNRLIYAKDIDYDYDEREVREKTGKLIKVRGFKVSETKVVDTVEEHWILANGVRVALYSTEKKALKVLDYLQIHLLDLENARNNNFALNNYVFQMPQDDEVM